MENVNYSIFSSPYFFFFFLVQSPKIWKIVCRLFKSKITRWSSNFPSGCVSKGNEINILKRYLHPMFTATLITIVKTQRQRKHSSALTMTTAEPYIPYVESRKTSYKWTYLQNRKRLTDLENEFMVSRGERTGGRDSEFGMDLYTLLYLKWITNKDLLHSIGNSACC